MLDTHVQKNKTQIPLLIHTMSTQNGLNMKMQISKLHLREEVGKCSKTWQKLFLNLKSKRNKEKIKQL